MTQRKAPRATDSSPVADTPETPARGEPLPVRVISDVETLRALTDPVRMRILEAMVGASGEDWTVKRIAKTLGVGPTKLYHHMRILEEHDFIRPSVQQLVRGIVETSYRIAQTEIRLDRAFLAAADREVRASTHEAFLTIFDLARADFEKAIELGLMDPTTGEREGEDPDADRLLTLTRSAIRVTRAKAQELRTRILALIEEYDRTGAGSEAVSGDGPEISLGVFVSMHPLPDSGKRRASRRKATRR